MLRRSLLLLAFLAGLLAPERAEAAPPRPGARPIRHPRVHRPVAPCPLPSPVQDTVSDLETVVETAPDDPADTGGAPTSSLQEFPNTDDAENVEAMLRFLAGEHGLPEDLVFAVAWTESSWTQWKDDGSVLSSGTSDYGLMQVNRATWEGTYDWSSITSDVRENALAGVEILDWSYEYCQGLGYTGDDLLKATYAVYNGGPDAHARPWDASSPWHGHDTNFWSNYTAKPWVD